MERRELLKRAGIGGAVGVTGIAAYGRLRNDGGPTDADGSAPNDSDLPAEDGGEDPPRYADEFETVVDVVRAGADPSGDEPVGDLLADRAGDDTLLSFPPGTYRLPPIEISDYDRLGIAAAGDERPTFRAPEGSCGNMGRHARFLNVTDFLLDGIDFDFRAEGAGGSVAVIAAGDAAVHDVTVEGSCRTQTSMFRMEVRNPDGTGVAENVRVRDDQRSTWLTGGYVGEDHSGELTFRNCEFSEFTDNGLYGSSPGVEGGGDGAVHTVDSRFENNNVSNIRLGSSGSTARGDAVVVDSPPEAERTNLRGIRFRRGTDQIVDDCEIRFGPAVRESFGAIVYHADNRGARVVDSHVTVDGDGVPAVRAFYATDEEGDPPAFDGLTIDGAASRGFAVDVEGRNGTSIRDCTIEQAGSNRDGIRLAYSSNCELIDSRIDVTGYPLILRDATLRIRNTTFVTPAGERHVDEMDAGPGDFRPESWATASERDDGENASDRTAEALRRGGDRREGGD